MEKTSPIDYISRLTGRNVLTVYTDFLNLNRRTISIDSTDMPRIITIVQQMDPSKGLDLILHAAKGDLFFVERLVKYLHAEFRGDIRIIIPHAVAFESTMLAFSGAEILMPENGVMGYIRAEFDGTLVETQLEMLRKAKEEIQEIQQKYSTAVLEIADMEKRLEEAKLMKKELNAILKRIRKGSSEESMTEEQAKEEIKIANAIIAKLRKKLTTEMASIKKEEGKFKNIQGTITGYPLGTYYKLLDAQNLNKKLIQEWLLKYHFDSSDRKADKPKVKRIADAFTGKKKQFKVQECAELGLNITPLESDERVLDAVMQLDAICDEYFEKVGIAKIIEGSVVYQRK